MNIKDKIIEKYRPEIVDDKVKIVPISQHNWKVAPISDTDKYILISLDDFACITQHFAQFNETLDSIEEWRRITQ